MKHVAKPKNRYGKKGGMPLAWNFKCIVLKKEAGWAVV